jgi:antagonist of KipI
MSLRILKNGVLDAIQDAGRYGYQHLGVNPGGAMDPVAMRIANALVGNDPATAVIEMHFPAAEIEFEEPVLIALAGADFSASINGEPVPILHPVLVSKGAILRFGKKQTGARIYLSVQGGFIADEWLDSYATNSKVKAGGFKGRALLKRDQLLCKNKRVPIISHPNNGYKILPWRAKITDLYVEKIIRFIPGNEFAFLKDLSKQQLTTTYFSITQESDRMGYRLAGNDLFMTAKKEMISTATSRGTIQLLPSGQLIILMADHQTTGGYPRVGHVISADIPSLAQLPAGEKICFEQVAINTAENILLEQEKTLQQIQNACSFRLSHY